MHKVKQLELGPNMKIMESGYNELTSPDLYVFHGVKIVGQV